MDKQEQVKEAQDAAKRFISSMNELGEFLRIGLEAFIDARIPVLSGKYIHNGNEDYFIIGCRAKDLRRLEKGKLEGILYETSGRAAPIHGLITRDGLHFREPKTGICYEGLADSDGDYKGEWYFEGIEDMKREFVLAKGIKI